MGNIRRSRGYAWENWIVKKFNKSDGWQSRRLGGSSVGLPDIVATYNDKSHIYTIEAKSAVHNVVYIPGDQVKRCYDVLKFLNVYTKQNILFAIKFSKNNKDRFNKKGQKIADRRKQQLVFDRISNIENIDNIQYVKYSYPDLKRTVMQKDPDKNHVVITGRYQTINQILSDI